MKLSGLNGVQLMRHLHHRVRVDKPCNLLALQQFGYSLRASSAAASREAKKRILVLVESPTKAKTITKYLSDQPSFYTVQSTMGHLRDLASPSKGASARAAESTSVRRFGVDIENGFAPVFVNLPEKGQVIERIKAAASEADEIILATDGDREGEAISWHIRELLQSSVPHARATFHEITKDAILKAFSEACDVNMHLVESQITRRVLDRLTGFSLSLVFLRKSLGASAGRVQSAALAVLCRREEERLRFNPSPYFSVTALCTAGRQKTFPAKLVRIGPFQLTTPADGAAAMNESSCVISTAEGAERVVAWLSDPSVELRLVSARQQQVRRKAPPPLITSTMQQEASKRLGMSPARTMSMASQLYEQGHITYYRTDDPVLSQGAIDVAKQAVVERFGEQYVGVIRKAAKPKNSQEAHEAIRPTIVNGRFLRPEELNVPEDLKRFYALVYQRTLASMMADTVSLQTTYDVEARLPGKTCVVSEGIEGDALLLRATGSKLLFEGFRAALGFGKREMDDESDDMDGGVNLPDLNEGVALAFAKADRGKAPDIRLDEHTTKPPGRYSEASFIKEIEQLGLGRPSTYATILEKLKERKYVSVRAKSIRPTIMGLAATAFLRKFYPEIIDTSFTANMEMTLDEIALGNADRVKFLHDFYFGDSGLEKTVEVMSTARIQQSDTLLVELPALKDSGFTVHVGPYGPYARCSDEAAAKLDISNKTATLNEEMITDVETITAEALSQLFIANHTKKHQTSELGTLPSTGQAITLCKGQYGHYLLAGTYQNNDSRTWSLPESYANQMNAALALAICELPKVITTHEVLNEPISLGMDRNGLYLKVGNAPAKYALPADKMPWDIVPGDVYEYLPQTDELEKTLPVKLGTYKRQDVYTGTHKRVRYVMLGDSKVVYIPQTVQRSIDLDYAKEVIDNPPTFGFKRRAGKAKAKAAEDGSESTAKKSASKKSTSKKSTTKKAAADSTTEEALAKKSTSKKTTTKKDSAKSTRGSKKTKKEVNPVEEA